MSVKIVVFFFLYCRVEVIFNGLEVELLVMVVRAISSSDDIIALVGCVGGGGVHVSRALHPRPPDVW